MQHSEMGGGGGGGSASKKEKIDELLMFKFIFQMGALQTFFSRLMFSTTKNVLESIHVYNLKPT